jgi:DMSO/TMAO reductase YedYZ heme-binding membrane subunit
MIALSFALSGICHFFKNFEDKIIYRKYLGITGFYYGLTHGLFSLYTYFFDKAAPMPTYEFFKIWTLFGMKISNVVAFLFGLTALLYFLFMTLNSNQKGQKIFKQKWRLLLRIGYGAVFFVLIHFALKKAGWWRGWFSNLKLAVTLPPLSLIVLIILLLVIILRIALHISIQNKKE